MRARLRLHQTPRLLVRKTRFVRWQPVLGGAAVGFAVLFQGRAAAASALGFLIASIRVAAVALCLGAVFLLDDPAAETVAPAASPLRYRRCLRLALGIPLVAAAWAGLLLYADRLVPKGTTEALPVQDLTLELVGMLAVALGVAALATRWVPERLGGVAAGPTLLVLLGTSLLLPRQWTLFPGSPADPQWPAAHGRWAAIVALGILLFLHSSRDPAAVPSVRRYFDRLGTLRRHLTART